MRHRMVVAALAAAWLGAGASGGRSQVAGGGDVVPQRPLEIDDLFRLGEVADPRVSPEGDWVAYTVTTSDLAEDESESRIWMVPVGGGDAVPLTAPGSSASHPRWSPDGRHLAFLSDRLGGEDQLFTLFRQGGDAVQVTQLAQGVRDFGWAPDGRRLVLVIKDPTPRQVERQRLIDAGEEVAGEDEEQTTPPWVITRKQFKEDYVGYLDSRRDHLWVLDLVSRQLTQVTSGDYDDSEPTFSPDGRLIAFVSNRSADPDGNYDTNIWAVPADSPDRGGTLAALSRNPGPDRSPAWSPDGSTVAFVSATDVAAIDYATNHLAVAAVRGGDERVLTAALDRNVTAPRFAPDGRSIYFVLEDSGEQNLARIPAAGGAVERLVNGPTTVDAFDLDRGGELTFLASEPQRPPEVYRLRPQGALRLTRTNDEVLAGIRLGSVANVHFSSADGTPLEGFLVEPPGFDPALRYPTLLLIHGGPMAQYDYRFDFEAQLFAAHGYLVVMPNPRGSTGYGQAFSLAIWQDWGGPDYQDVMAAVDDAIARGFADPARLGVGGWSYGGMLTNHVITRTDRFKAAVTGASAALYVVNYGHDQYQRWWEGELGLPWRNRDLWEKLSPFNRVESIVTPTLIVGGERDWNVPIINSEQLYEALRRLGRTTELVVYPGEYHGLETPSYLKDLYQRELDWYGRYVKGEVPAALPTAASPEVPR